MVEMKDIPGEEMPSPDKQKSIIDELANLQLAVGQTWYLLSSTWYRSFKRYCDQGILGSHAPYESPKPGVIDNSDLLGGEDEHLRSSLVEGVDFELMPEEAWNHLVSWYGLKSPSSAISRTVIENGCYVKYLKVEVYLLELHLYMYPQKYEKDCVRKRFSKSKTLEHLMEEMKAIFKIPADRETRLWGTFGSEMQPLKNLDTTLQDEGIYSGQMIHIEAKDEDGTWPRVLQTSPFALPAPATTSTTTPGLCGLSNMGNTCFMNSAIQCMSNVPPLTKYFRNKYHLRELNKSNPLGMRGEIAKEYGEVINTIWSGRNTYFAPRVFKQKVGQFAPQFSGFQQHDSQELLAFLLDGLHEDLNRIYKKPYIEVKDADGRPDEVVATEAWENHKRRNDSVITDLFHGLFKSTLICPDCQKVSVTFDPYCFLTLPLPVKRQKVYDVTLYRLNPEVRPMKYRVLVPDGSCVMDLQNAVSEITNNAVAPENMLLTVIFGSRVHKIYQASETLTSVFGKEEWSIYETPATSVNKADSKWRFVPLYFREKNSTKNLITGGFTCFGHPLFLALPNEPITYDELYEIALKRIKCYLKDDENIDQGALGDPDTEEMDVTPTTGSGMLNGAAKTTDIDNFDENGHVEESPEPITCQPQLGDEAPKKNYLFDLSLVYQTGSTEVQKLDKKKQEPFTLSPQACVAMDWKPSVKKHVYRGEAEEVARHPSVDVRPDMKRAVELRDCIELFLSKEKLGPSDPWYCPRCKDHKQATKKFDLWSLPPFLVIHLKRFSYNRYSRDKLDNLVKFPKEALEFNQFVINPKVGHQVYDLIGVVNHYGGLGGGHYTAYCKNEAGQWFDYDDTRVSKFDGDSVETTAAYVLFYQRRERTPINIVPAAELSENGAAAAANPADNEDMEVN